MNLAEHLSHPLFKVVSEAAAELGCNAYVIGGYVRDMLLKRPCVDIDFVTDGDGIKLAQLCADKLENQHVNVFKNFGTAMFAHEGYDLEFVGARKESYSPDSRKPSVTTGTLKDDQDRRDFTINALAIDLAEENYGEVIDPFEGLSDLEKGIIKTPLDPNITYSDDPLRMMRAIRFSSQLGFDIEKESFSAIKKNAYRLEIISQERITTEFNKIMLSPKPSVGLVQLFDSELLHQFFPEMVALQGVEEKNGVLHKDNFYHTLQVIDNVAENSDNLWLRWAALLHDIAKPPTKRFHNNHGWTFHGHEDLGSRMVPKLFKRLKLPLDNKMRFVKKLVLLHLRPIALTKEEITDSAVRRLIFEAGDDIEELMILAKADITSKNEKKVKRYLKNYIKVQLKIQEVEEKDRIRNFQPPITGEYIMETFGIGPCREVGEIKNRIKDAILDGKIENDFTQAKKFMLRLGVELGLKAVE